MDIYARENTYQQSDAKKKKENEAHASLHNPVKLFWLLTCLNVGNNFTPQTNLIFSCSLMKITHGFNMNKTKNHCSCSYGNRKLTGFIRLLQIIIYKEVLRQ